MSNSEEKIKELQKKIDSFENLRDELSDEFVDKKIAELQTLINTEGGAVVTGDINTGGGDFTGRDKIININQFAPEQKHLGSSEL